MRQDGIYPKYTAILPYIVQAPSQEEGRLDAVLEGFIHSATPPAEEIYGALSIYLSLCCISDMSHALFIFAGVAYLGGLAFACVVSRRSLAKISDMSNRALVMRVGGIVGGVSVIPAAFLAIVVGGNLGGSIGEVAGTVGLVLGISLGIFSVTVIGILAPSVASGYLARLFAQGAPNNST